MIFSEGQRREVERIMDELVKGQKGESGSLLLPRGSLISLAVDQIEAIIKQKNQNQPTMRSTEKHPEHIEQLARELYHFLIRRAFGRVICGIRPFVKTRPLSFDELGIYDGQLMYYDMAYFIDQRFERR